MRFALVALMCLLTIARPAHAGAWLREVATGFLSLSTTIRSLNQSWQIENSIYGEYGIAPRLTLGVDINEIPDLLGHALVFVRLPISPVEGRTKMALQLGLGGHHVHGQWAEMAKVTLSVGRGFSSRWGAGWVNVDAGAELRQPTDNLVYKLDATIGLSAGARIRPLLQFESSYISGIPLIWSVLPGVLIEGRNGTSWQIALERKSASQTSFGLKVGLWRSF